MRILHTADLHLGQILYQYYERTDEHDHFFAQLTDWCHEYHPDALLVSGDLFDIQQPGAAVKAYFNRTFADLHRQLPDMAIIATAGNHDSASRIEADRAVWALSGVTLAGNTPAVVALPAGFVVAVPFMAVYHPEAVQALLDQVATQNTDGLPVVLMAHLAVAGSDFTGHGDIGTLRTLPPQALGQGYDYAALGHIHRPQTLAHPFDMADTSATLPAPLIRYSGSPLHVSCDEQYPHSVSLVDIDTHGGTVTVKPLRIDELRHFYILPDYGHPAATSADELYTLLSEFCHQNPRGYIRLRVDSRTALPTDFQQAAYRILEATGNEVRYNPNILWENLQQDTPSSERPLFEVPELQQMADPLDFIRKTIDQYPEFDINDLEADFAEVERELHNNQ